MGARRNETLWHKIKGDADYKTQGKWGTGGHIQESGETIKQVTHEEGQVT